MSSSKHLPCDLCRCLLAVFAYLLALQPQNEKLSSTTCRRTGLAAEYQNTLMRLLFGLPVFIASVLMLFA